MIRGARAEGRVSAAIGSPRRPVSTPVRLTPPLLRGSNAGFHAGRSPPGCAVAFVGRRGQASVGLSRESLPRRPWRPRGPLDSQERCRKRDRPRATTVDSRL